MIQQQVWHLRARAKSYVRNMVGVNSKLLSTRAIDSSQPAKKRCVVLNFNDGLVDYSTAWRYQKVLSEHIHRSRKSDDGRSPCYVIVVEHSRVFTLGRGGSVANLKFEVGAEESADVIRVERGGEVTWHGPGQLVVYPILDLDNHKRDLHWYTSQLEESVIRLLRDEYNVDSGRNDVNTGVWVQKNKIAAVGVTASRWITMHGISLNVNPTMTDFDLIVPCGIMEAGYGVCSLQQIINTTEDRIIDQNHQSTRTKLIDKLMEVFAFDEVEVLDGQAGHSYVAALLDKYPAVMEQALQINEL